MVQLLRLLSAAVLPLCRAAGTRARLSTATAARLLAAGYRSYAAPVSGVGSPPEAADMLSVKLIYLSIEKEKSRVFLLPTSAFPHLCLEVIFSEV